ncbi:TolC family protein [Paraglaciecola aquimarina]|uniref:TolC family protein n=1 Tax=Paraglaciecola algarum TaxID=3050085 RepID=A0ABS9D9Z0_9ALTE|nr:TolC family protein [Paraglaciecola sp. G1-23]MCF2948817.1 TolC family protein [Paraglaciecola sp. G1-23]MDN4504085.1 TolC family protein [Alteromonadaceae bacterium BrNp21-10]
MKLGIQNLSKVTVGLMIGFSAFYAQAEKVISLQQAIELAQQNDPWLHGSSLKQKAVENMSIASGTLPDPKISVGMMNLPTDTWNFDQEGMTQFKVGVSQMFPRGDSLALKQQQLKIESTQYPLLREDRKAKLKSEVSQLWLDVFLAQQTIKLIENDWELFEQMAEVAKASYSNAVGKTRQQDVIRAQLEIVQLEDRLTVQKQKLETSIARLNEWLHLYNDSDFEKAFDFDSQPIEFNVSEGLPAIRLQNPAVLTEVHYSRNALALALENHPAIRAIDVKKKVSEKAITIAKQQYKPQWGVNASYAYRDDMPSGDSRSDLFSVGVTFDLPLFTEDRQDKQVAASIAESEAIRTEKLLLIKQMISAIEKELRQLKRLSERQSIYKDQLLKQTNEQAESSLTAYTNDDGDFSEVVRARIAGLNARISALKIDVDALKTVARINYFFAQSNTKPVLAHTSKFGEK